ncbi:hypothetical protein CRN59_18125, partial [Vibrio vulnificus]
LSEGAKQHKALLERALLKAEKSGLLQRLIDQYWATEITQLQLNKRKVLKLVTP